MNFDDGHYEILNFGHYGIMNLKWTKFKYVTVGQYIRHGK